MQQMSSKQNIKPLSGLIGVMTGRISLHPNNTKKTYPTKN
jgi:hypothetical protein